MKVRLQKFLAECGIGSRRKSEKYISEGRVKVNSKIITKLGTKIDPQNDKVAFDNESTVIYSAVCMLLIRNETAGLHYVAAEILMHPLCHFEGAYAAALYHVRKAIELDPKDAGLKEVLIFLHDVPDQVVSKEEAISAAKQVLEERPGSKCARSLLERYEIGV